MPEPDDPIPAPLAGAPAQQVRAVLGAMRAVAETGGAASAADRAAIAACETYLFGAATPTAWDAVAPTAPAELAATLAGGGLEDDALKFAAVMALVDGKVDAAKIGAVAAYAAVLKRDPRYLDELTEAAEGHLQEALADMTRANMDSVTGKPWPGGDVEAWLVPYDGPTLDPRARGALRGVGHAARSQLRPGVLDAFPRKRLRLSRGEGRAERHLLDPARFRACDRGL